MRVCFGYAPGFLDTDYRGRLTGYHNHYWDAFFGPLINDPNTTLFGMSQPATDGCFDYIRQNKSDIGMVGAMFPIEGFVDDNLDMVARQGSIFGYNQFLVRSAYNKTAEYQENDIVDVFKVFDPKVLMAIIAFLSILFILLFSSFRLILKRNGRVSKKYQMVLLRKLQFVTFKVIFGSVLNQHSSYDIQVGRLSPWSLLITSFSLTLFTFLVNTFFTSMINTDLVSVERPVVIRSIEDILSRKNMHAVITDLDTEYNYFVNSPNGSLEHRLYSEKRLRPIRFSNISPYSPVVTTGPIETMSGKSVVINTYTIEIGLIEACCHFLYSSSVTLAVGRKMGTSLHSLTREHLRGYFMSTALEDRTVRTLDSRVTRVRESGLEVGLARETNSKLEKMDVIGDAPVESVMECVAGKVVLELPRVFTPAIIYYKSLFVVLLEILGVAGVVCVVEILIRRVLLLIGTIMIKVMRIVPQ